MANKSGGPTAPSPFSATLSKPLLNIKNSVMDKEENKQKTVMNGRYFINTFLYELS